MNYVLYNFYFSFGTYCKKKNIDWTSDSNSIHRLNHKQARLQAMMQYIHDHYMEEITLETIAASASISKSGALHIFQTGIHCSPVAYLIQYRLAQAAEQLYITQNRFFHCRRNRIYKFRLFLPEV